MNKVRIGCCGFPVSRKAYFNNFSLVELQQTFYKIPQIATAKRWRQEAPSNFEFTLKASQLITHPPTSPTYRRAGIKIPSDAVGCYGFLKPTSEVREAWEKTREFAEVLRAKVIVFQCPPSFKEMPENVDNMVRFFNSLKDSRFLFAWEPRGGWQEDTIRKLCSELGLIHCVDPFEKEPLHGEIQYFRLHGGAHYRHQYSQEELEYLRDKVENKESYVLFNNLSMYQDGLAFARLTAETQGKQIWKSLSHFMSIYIRVANWQKG